jgi:hypothetical protein
MFLMHCGKVFHYSNESALQILVIGVLVGLIFMGCKRLVANEQKDKTGRR